MRQPVASHEAITQRECVTRRPQSDAKASGNQQLVFIELRDALMARQLRWNANGLLMKASHVENGRLDQQDRPSWLPRGSSEDEGGSPVVVR